VALLTGYDGVASDKRKSGNVMIERRNPTPTGFRVTLLAAATKLAFVPIILKMTRYARRRELVAVEIAGVAGIALDLPMRASQRKLRVLVVIKVNGTPFGLAVAAVAFDTISSRMNILKLMAFNASRPNPLVALASMTT